jgi:uncharacterized protein HemX
MKNFGNLAFWVPVLAGALTLGFIGYYWRDVRPQRIQQENEDVKNYVNHSQSSGSATKEDIETLRREIKGVVEHLDQRRVDQRPLSHRKRRGERSPGRSDLLRLSLRNRLPVRMLKRTISARQL